MQAQAQADTQAESTITADVGHGPLPDGKEVPEEIADFEVWDCPNNNTVKWQRYHYPTEDIEMPRVREGVGITVQGDGWDVTRSVTFERSGTGHNIRTGEEFDTVVQDTQYYGCVGAGFDTFEDAVAFVEHHLQGLSKMGVPREVKSTSNPIRDVFHDIRMEEHRDDAAEEGE
jgi:hypothetical protein